MKLIKIDDFRQDLIRTSSILVAEVGKAPDVAQSDGVAQTGQEEIELVRPVASVGLRIHLLVQLLRAFGSDAVPSRRHVHRRVVQVVAALGHLRIAISVHNYKKKQKQFDLFETSDLHQEQMRLCIHGQHCVTIGTEDVTPVMLYMLRGHAHFILHIPKCKANRMTGFSGEGENIFQSFVINS